MIKPRHVPDRSADAAPPRWEHHIGIVGGLGPYAHIELERRLLKATERRLGRPGRDQDFPPWTVVSLPQTPDRTAALLGRGRSPVGALVRGLRLLRAGDGGADFAVIACNTAHGFIPRLERLVAIPILDMVTETMRHVAERFGPGASVGLLATSGTLASGIYADAARAASATLRVLSPLDLGLNPDEAHTLQERSVMGAVYGRSGDVDDLRGGIKAGGHRQPAIRDRITAELEAVVRLFRDAGACAVILGCTELPLVLDRRTLAGVELVDPLDVIAGAAVEIAAGDRPLPVRGARDKSTESGYNSRSGPGFSPRASAPSSP